MSTHKIDDLLATKAEAELQRRLITAVRGFHDLISELNPHGHQVQYQDVVALLVSQCVTQSYDRIQLPERMEKELKDEKTRAQIRNLIQQDSAKALLERVETLSSDVDDLRSEFS